MSCSEVLGVIATHLRPATGFGGVAECTSELIVAWRKAGRTLLIASSDGSCGRRFRPSEYEEALQGPVDLYRAQLAVRWGFGLKAPFVIANAIRRADRVYISGIATFPTTVAGLLAVLLNKPYVAATHGGLMPEHWAEISQRRPWKALFYKLFVFPILRRAIAVHTTSTIEAQAARNVLPGLKVFIAPNTYDFLDRGEPSSFPDVRDGLRLLYLGRLAPEKGILGFARAFAATCGPNDRLVIAGQPKGAYGAEVIDLCRASNALDYVGVLERDQLTSAFDAAHALVLPSGVDGPLQENFGNVVVESFAHGRPVVAVRGLAWDQAEADGMGLLLERDLGNLAQALSDLRAKAADPAWPSRVRRYADAFAPDKVAETMWTAAFPTPAAAEA